MNSDILSHDQKHTLGRKVLPCFDFMDGSSKKLLCKWMHPALTPQTNPHPRREPHLCPVKATRGHGWIIECWSDG